MTGNKRCERGADEGSKMPRVQGGMRIKNLRNLKIWFAAGLQYDLHANDWWMERCNFCTLRSLFGAQKGSIFAATNQPKYRRLARKSLNERGEVEAPRRMWLHRISCATGTDIWNRDQQSRVKERESDTLGRHCTKKWNRYKSQGRLNRNFNLQTSS